MDLSYGCCQQRFGFVLGVFSSGRSYGSVFRELSFV